jgi:hypothetical protein
MRNSYLLLAIFVAVTALAFLSVHYFCGSDAALLYLRFIGGICNVPVSGTY